MITLELDGVEVDHCLSCAGIWLDSGELELLTRQPDASRVIESALEDGKRGSGTRRCPICKKKMDCVMIGSNHEIEIDRCTRNHGIWFDRGELEQIAALLDDRKQSAVADLLRRTFNENG
jgi:hypothetical protein